MDQIRDSILKCGINAVDDDTFVEELNKIIEKEGDDCCQTVIHTLTSLDFPPEDTIMPYYACKIHKKTYRPLALLADNYCIE